MKFASTFQQSTEIFFILWKKLEASGTFKPVYKSEGQPMMNGKQRWHECLIDTTMLCNGDNTTEFRVDFMAAMDSGDHRCIGTKMLTIDEMNSMTYF